MPAAYPALWNLRHASTSVTLDTYTHLTEDKKREQEAVAQTVRIS